MLGNHRAKTRRRPGQIPVNANRAIGVSETSLVVVGVVCSFWTVRHEKWIYIYIYIPARRRLGCLEEFSICISVGASYGQ